MAVRFKRSYRDRKKAVARRKKTIINVLILVFFFQVLFSVFFGTIRVDSISMEPSMEVGSAMIFSPFVYGYKIGTSIKRFPQVKAPERGDIIVLTPPYVQEKRGFVTFLFSIIRFLSFGKINLSSLLSESWENRFLVKRIIALPGDTVKMSDFTASIKPGNSEYFLNEFEVIHSSYDTNMGELPAGWNDSLPFSGNMDPVTLGDNEYFVLGDNRMQSSDSTSWGILHKDRIAGKILMAYWPLNKIKVFE
ncbi:MAG: signal peptidase I [Spirochaetaceae bacterium]|nr:signal peptidase I [Spirochaetaceae bacterium]